MVIEGPSGAQAHYVITRHPAHDLPVEYIGMILSQWMRSYRFLNDYVRDCDSDHYFREYEKFIRAKLSEPNAMVRVATLSDDADVVLGWSLRCDSVLHYVYVRRDSKSLGIGRALVGHFDTVTHMTKPARKLWKKYYKHAKLFL